MRAHGCQHHAVTFGRSSTTAFAHKAASYNVVGPQMPCEISRRTQACINYTAGRRWLCSVRPPSRPPRHTEPRMRARCGCAPSAFRSWNIGRSQDARKQSGRQTRSIERAELVKCSEQQLHTWDKVVKSIVLPSVSTDDYQIDQHSILVCPMLFVKPTGPESAHRLA